MAPPSIPASLRIGPLEAADPAKVGGHRLVGRLGTGAMGTVYAALAPDGSRRALELAHREWDPAAQEPPVPEPGAHLLGARASGRHGGRPWAALEHVPGPDLATWVEERGALSDGALLCLAAGVADALARVHAAGTVHGDVEPRTVLMAPDGPRVRDFGVARGIDDSAPARVAGAPGWLAPERYAGAPPEPASDVFAWACVVVLGASGAEPFGSEGTLAELEERARLNRVELSDVPVPLRPVLRRALSVDPGERPTARSAAQACLRALERGVGGAGETRGPGEERGGFRAPGKADGVGRRSGENGGGDSGTWEASDGPGDLCSDAGEEGGGAPSVLVVEGEHAAPHEVPRSELDGGREKGGAPPGAEAGRRRWLKRERSFLFRGEEDRGRREGPSRGGLPGKRGLGSLFGKVRLGRGPGESPGEGRRGVPEDPGKDGGRGSGETGSGSGPGSGTGSGSGIGSGTGRGPGEGVGDRGDGGDRDTSRLRPFLDRLWPEVQGDDDDAAWNADPPRRSGRLRRFFGGGDGAASVAALVAGVLVALAATAGGGAFLLDALGPDEPEHQHPSSFGEDLLVRARDTVLGADAFELTVLTHGGNGSGPRQSTRTRGPTVYDRVRYQAEPEEVLRWNSTVGGGGPTSDRMWWDGRLLDAGGTSAGGDPASWAEPPDPGEADAHTPEVVTEPLRSAIEDGRVIGYREADYVPSEPAEDAYAHLADGQPAGERDALWVEGEFATTDNPAAEPAVFTLVTTAEGVPLAFSWEEQTHFHLRPTSSRLSPEDLGTGEEEYPRWWYTEYTFVSFDAEVDLPVPDPDEVRASEHPDGGQ
ncbi:serine/threonine protein kinase [Nocardiopsis sp. HNM0947]|uniref:Serine/threonine protein kinase n=1 Tax=Nocardiopsis coralli TaxID=2772213 RepID=A0ABR9PES5_9ACTN|nr:serine/threonine-protein kinase [Nocardiopsis coralli]MBE3002331.1 serine/threonine protein kinase [Nocardiopsis coralli]